MQDPDGRHYGYSLQSEAGVRSGTLYPMLRRMLGEGWLADGWEDPAEAEGRPARRYYTITERGKAELGALAILASQASPSSAPPRGPAFGHGFAW